MARPSTDVPATTADAVTDAVLTASRLLVAVSARSIAAAGDLITLPQFRVLVILHSRGTLNQAALAGLVGVTPSTTSRMVDRLVAVGMVARQDSPSSRREIVVELTGEGERVVRLVTGRRRREIARIVAKMPEGARHGLVEALTAFAEAGGEPPARTSIDAAWF
ncbi:MarR family winged helix-turn-helix transcriptional regulator [Amycolatopsis sp. FDAARGOS 1241]|uniref:MarR family winged helix-turn-helix transcriptional regulator n=1 Tax=Amycolatopsis sp. FDAARGOS 1241 TaxID=2778070 RepID=UPI00194F0167|nr:MarR family transcriptional regulator [Amycolatopsis sp. FDAARGOS 1241]QRP50080.1 MarR family transcriptional regulator [Amycolatopsis sp. FDAARGOS 1241]